MKIGIDVHSVGSGNGGNETYYRSLINALPWIDSENQYFLYYTYPDAFAAGEPHANFQPRRVQPNTPYVRIPFALPRQIRQEPIDVFHAQFILPPFVGSRMVTTIPDIGYEHYPQFFPLYQRAWSRLLIRASARRADHIITVSEHSKNDIAETYGIDREKITVTPESPSENFYPRQRAKAGEVVAKYGVKSSFILYLGRLQGRKNLTRLVNAYSRIRREGGEQKLVLAGKPDSFFQATRSRIHELRLDDDILLPGYVSPEDVPWLYSAADIFVYPSLYEGFGLPVLEAMACGVPVITSQGSSLQEVVGDAGLLVDPLDELSIASAIRRLVSDSSLRRQLSDAGLKRSSDFSGIEMARRTLEVYQRVLGHETTRASVGTSAKAV